MAGFGRSYKNGLYEPMTAIENL